MIYITGDCHGDFSRFNSRNFPEQREMKKEDYVIICGDFGYWDKSKEIQHWMDWLNDKPFTTLWIDGNHENYDMLAELPVEEWNGGKIQRIKDSVIHLMRGQVYQIDEIKIFAFGGAKSHDIEGGILEVDAPNFKLQKKRLDRSDLCYRINHISWWKEEMPCSEEYVEGIKNLGQNYFDVDFIVTHCCSTSTQGLLSGGMYESDELTDYFEDIKEKIKFKKWFFGHYHVNQNVTPNEIALYEQIIRIA